MKKIYALILFIAFATGASAQTFPNAGFETWRSGTAGGHTVYAPDQWYGFDSLVLAEGSMFALLIHFGTPWNGSAQNFQETTIVHSGTSSAKLMTLRQDTLGYFPGVLTNAMPGVNTTALLALVTGGGSTASAASALTYSGGTPVTQRITSVSAWVQYMPGVDSTGAPGNDSGLMLVQAIGTVGGTDSTLGAGAMVIAPTAGSWVQITANVIYTDTTDLVDTIRVSFASSGGARKMLDSSTLYVDDVSMTGVSEAVPTVATNSLVKVYPNPAANLLHIDMPTNLAGTYHLYNVSGQVVMGGILNSTNELNTANLPSGLYFYSITDAEGNTVQRGKVAVEQ